jgi:hypothetical protein
VLQTERSSSFKLELGSLKGPAAMCEHHEPFEPEKRDRMAEVCSGSIGVTADIFAFLTCEPNAEVGEVHPDAGDPDDARGA